MQRQFKQRYLILLAVIVLLLQSFAVWHDATHPFHTSGIQCERFNAINHLPVADLITEIHIAHYFVSVSFDTIQIIPTLSTTQREQHHIRAPPFFS